MAIVDAEERFLREVDRLEKYMVKHIQGMIRMPSENPPGGESQVASYVAEDCETICDIRTVPGMSPEGVVEDIRAVVRVLASRDLDLHATVNEPLRRPGEKPHPL